MSPEGFELALKLLKWDEYVRDESATSPFRDQSSGTMWNSGDKNGWDLCHLMRLYMERIGKTHLSFAEAVMEGEVEELVPLRREVGVADAVSDDEACECMSINQWFLTRVFFCLLVRRIAVLLARAEGGSGGDVGGSEGGGQNMRWCFARTRRGRGGCGGKRWWRSFRSIGIRSNCNRRRVDTSLTVSAHRQLAK